MKIFISQSGERSLAIARALRDWLPNVIQAVQPWLSEVDIGKGTRWEQEIGAELAQTRFGIICLTPENLGSRWINFEAGALSKTIERTYVCTYLLDLKPTDIEGPLSQFNHTRIERDDSRKLLHTINKALNDQRLEADIVNAAFDLWWPRLQEKLAQLPEPGARLPPRKPDDMIEEILGIIRLQAKEAESREDDFYKSRDSFMALVIGLFQSALQGAPNLPPDLTKHMEEFKQHASAYYLNKRDISKCPDCQGTGYTQVDNKGVQRCEHERLNDMTVDTTL